MLAVFAAFGPHGFEQSPEDVVGHALWSPAEAVLDGHPLDAPAVLAQLLLTAHDAILEQLALAVLDATLAWALEAQEPELPSSLEEATRRFAPAKTIPAAAIAPTMTRESFDLDMQSSFSDPWIVVRTIE
jgi:hypothetical protein